MPAASAKYVKAVGTRDSGKERQIIYPARQTSPTKPFVGWSPIRFEAATRDGVWEGGQLKSNSNYAVDATSVGVQFGQSVFEGMTAWLGADDQVFLFRVADHYARLKASCTRLAIPAPPFALFERGLHEAIKLRAQFENPLPSRLVYIRPVVVGTTPHIMPVPAEDYLLTISVAPYFPSAIPDRLRLKVEPKFRRTAERGLGSAKTASNYAHLFAPSEMAKQQGYDSLLWLESDSSERITEASSMNVFFVTSQGLLTPTLNEHLLPGLTRDSAIRVAREELGMNVDERAITVNDIENWHRAGELEGMFITSTARGIRPVSALNVSGDDIDFDCRKNFACQKIASRLKELREGTGDDPYGWRQTLTLETQPGDRDLAEHR